MSSRRLLKAAAAIREVVAAAILRDLKDPRVREVTITMVEVAPDMRSARVHVSVRGDEGRQRLTLQGLQHSAGFLQHLIAKRIDTRYTPVLHFVLDQGVKKSAEVAAILKEVLPPEPAPVEADAEWIDPEEESFADYEARKAAERAAEDADETDRDEAADESADDPSADFKPPGAASG